MRGRVRFFCFVAAFYLFPEATASAQTTIEQLGAELAELSQVEEGPIDLALSTAGPEAIAIRLRVALQRSIEEQRPGSAVQLLASGRTRHTSNYQLDVRCEVVGHAMEFHVQAFSHTRSRIGQIFAPEPTRIFARVVRHSLDAHLRSLLGAAAPELRATAADTIQARTARLRRRAYLAVGVHDFDQDGHNELALVRADGIEIARLHRTERGFRAEHVVTLDLDDIPRSATRSRRPIATMTHLSDGVLVRTSEHAPFIRVYFENEYLRTEAIAVDCLGDGFPLGDSCAVRVRGRDYFQAELIGRGNGAVPPPAPSGFFARALETALQPDGTPVTFEAIATPRGRLVSRVNETQGGAQGYGAALGMADVDQDGAVELLASSDNSVGSGDALRLLRVTADGRLLRVWESDPLRGSVMVAGAGDVDGDGAAELLAIEEPIDPTERAVLWVVR